MSKETFITRFSLIIKRLERGPATFQQIADYLEKESDLQDRNFNLSIRTLQRDIKDIYEQLEIEIVNEKKGDKRYFIKSRPEGQEHSTRLLEAYDMLSIVKSSQQYNKYIFFEPRKPKGLELFRELLSACSSKKIVSFSYHKFGTDNASGRTVHPLALKESRGRWYLVAVDTKDSVLKTFGLDRIGDIDISTTSFREKYNINIEEEFKFAFGVINSSDSKPQKIILSLTYEQGQYLINYPLHHSQTTIKEAPNEVVLQLYLLVTYDLVMELMSYGENVKVVQPKILINELQLRFENVVKLYGKN